ncbi:GNAT family N-acetyltransferase [Bacillus sp. Bva_UNVM-123]|uniref:GNAT family N-acetyltransferase n=1 Tax=Bacillus sp. Bva_UNVM-123 TaxID=2829798 RepID=UPI00391F743D
MLDNKIIRLRTIEEQDVHYIQKWHNDYETTKNTTLTSFIPRNLEEEKRWYVNKLTDSNSRIFIIEYIQTLSPIGVVSFSNLDYRNQKAMLSIVMGECEYRGKGLASQALQLIEGLLVNEFNIRKVTVQILSFNHPSLSLFRKNGYVEEGCLKQEVYRNGEFFDLFLMSKFLK